MKYLKYFFQFLFITFLLIFFKFIGLKLSRVIAGNIFLFLGPLFRSKNTIAKNILIAFPNTNHNFRSNIAKKMWKNYGKILTEYVFIKNFRENKTEKFLKVKGQKILDKIKISKDPVIFVSGHFNNFELMAMHIEKSGIDLAAIYRPLNNNFLNPLMENIRKKYICSKQIKKGISGTKKILKFFNSGTSVALMIDQRVSQGIKANFFGKLAYTTTIPAQFVKKFNAKIVPIYIERLKENKFSLEIYDPLVFNKTCSILEITNKLNHILEKMILKNPDQWIWTHNRWK